VRTSATRGARCVIQCLDSIKTAVAWEDIAFEDIKGQGPAGRRKAVRPCFFINLCDCHSMFGVGAKF